MSVTSSGTFLVNVLQWKFVAKTSLKFLFYGHKGSLLSSILHYLFYQFAFSYASLAKYFKLLRIFNVCLVQLGSAIHHDVPKGTIM